MKAALIVVDYQNDFVHGSLGFEGATLLEQPIVEAIMAARARGDQIIFTYDTHPKNYEETAEGRWLPVSHCQEGTTGHDLYGAVADCVQPQDIKLQKSTFGSDQLLTILQQEQFDRVCLVGLVSYICVTANAVIARVALPQAEVVVDANAIGGADPVQEQKALDVLEGMMITVINRNKE